MMENIVLLIFQGVTGCRSLAVKDNDGEKLHLVKEVLTVVP